MNTAFENWGRDMLGSATFDSLDASGLANLRADFDGKSSVRTVSHSKSRIVKRNMGAIRG
jgi:hypothetical protein